MGTLDPHGIDFGLRETKSPEVKVFLLLNPFESLVSTTVSDVKHIVQPGIVQYEPQVLGDA